MIEDIIKGNVPNVIVNAFKDHAIVTENVDSVNHVIYISENVKAAHSYVRRRSSSLGELSK